MTTVAQMRKAALGLPEVEEGTHFGMVAFSIRGRGFASVTKDDAVQLQMTDDDAERALAAHPTAERLERMGRPIGIRVPLADVDGQALNGLVYAAWRSRAPKRLAERAARTDSGVASPDSDLPPAIGKPATRALLGAGITTLADVARSHEAQLRAMHGVGPKAIRVLKQALAERGHQLD